MSGVSRHSIAREGRRWHRSRGRILTRSRSRSRRWSCKSHAVFFSFSRVGWVSRFQVARWMRYQIHSNTTPLTLVVSLFVPVWYQHQSIHFSRWVWVLPHAITAISLRNPNFLAARLPWLTVPPWYPIGVGPNLHGVRNKIFQKAVGTWTIIAIVDVERCPDQIHPNGPNAVY